MRYVSTRGGVAEMPFCAAVMMGLADDGGLLIPKSIPNVADRLDHYRTLSYQELAFDIMRLFIDDINDDTLAALIQQSYQHFDDARVTPLLNLDAVGNRLHILELFHGPTLAFKDVALQFLGNVFAHILREEGPHEAQMPLNILGATSGDTGSAAIAGVRGKASLNIFTMFPEGHTSTLQEKQMTTVLDDNVWNIAIKGSFDDCQSILKSVFSDPEFKQEFHLAAVNSVNWARILAQVVYYFSAHAQLGSPAGFEVAVPTGNFGNIFAGYMARTMGLPIRKLILATNRNDILHRFFTTGRYERGPVHFSHSPAMDIQVASNLERYLYFQPGGDAGGAGPAARAEKVRAFMSSFSRTGSARINFNTRNFDSAFASGAAAEDDTLEVIRQVYDVGHYTVDPHTAVGLCIGQKLRDPTLPLVCLATAHPAKFEDAIGTALPGAVVTHPTLETIRDLPSRKTVLKADVNAVKAFIRACNQG